MNQKSLSPKGTAGRNASWLLIILGALIFIVCIPGSSLYWYRQGAGRIYGVQRDVGASHEIAAPQAHSMGIIHAVSMVLGFPVPVFMLYAVLVAKIGRLAEGRERLMKLISVSCIVVGWFSLGIAKQIRDPNDPFVVTLISSAFIWAAIVTVFAIPLGIASIVKRLRCS